MLERHALVEGIPTVFWGADSPRRILAVHDTGGSKQCRSIRALAALAVPLGWQVVSFDLPGHGTRRREWNTCLPGRCAGELRRLTSVLTPGRRMRLFAEGQSAQWAVLALQNTPLEQALFLAPALGPGLPLKRWDTPTEILELPGDGGCAFGTTADFARKWGCRLDRSDDTAECRRHWVERCLNTIPN